MKISKRMYAAATAACALTASIAPAALAQEATPYVVGGNETSVEWIVQLEFQTYQDGPNKAFGCTGEQLNEEWTLTARHCIDDVSRMNVYQSNDQLNRGEPIAVDSVHAAPSGDIALVHLSEDSPLSSYPEVDATYGPTVGDRGRIYGYGLGAYQQPTDYLRTATVSVIGESVDAYLGPAAHLRGSSGAANKGDSGGPFMIDGKIVAVCSTGDTSNPGGNINATSNYALLSQSATWIENTSGVDVTPNNGEQPAPVEDPIVEYTPEAPAAEIPVAEDPSEGWPESPWEDNWGWDDTWGWGTGWSWTSSWESSWNKSWSYSS